MSPKTNTLYTLIVLVFILALSQAFRSVEPDLAALIMQSEKRLNEAYAIDLEGLKIKKAEIKLTKDGFFRYRRTFFNGKQEYFALNFSQFEDLDYLGNTRSGFVVLKTLPESIIVQTFHDPNGDIDSMASVLKMPIKDIEVQDLVRLQYCFFKMRDQLKKTSL